ncbi:MAG: phage portal protein family protein [Marinifilaceae bacterium]
MENKSKNNRILVKNKKRAYLGANTTKHNQKREGLVPKLKLKSLSQTKADIQTWQNALRSAGNIDEPRRAKLYNLYRNVLLDAHLSSQIELRTQHLLSTPFLLTVNDNTDDELTKQFSNSMLITSVIRQILDSIYWGHRMIEFSYKDNNLTCDRIHPNNVVPEKGIVLIDETGNECIKYRELPDYNTWILEFGDNDNLGLLNQAVAHVLMKRFAQSCWSELCEIYGIPPRFIKTETSDPEMLDRAEEMLRDMGSAAYFIIDNSEEFQFAKGADTNGDVYSNLIRLCKEELSLLICGATIGQDTKNGNRSKEESSIELLKKIVLSDKALVEGYMNTKVIPALKSIGWMANLDATFQFQQEQDLDKLWTWTSGVIQHMDVDPDWINETFGIKVSKRTQQDAKLKIDTSGFFD